MTKTSYQQKFERIGRMLEHLKAKDCTATELHQVLKELPDAREIER